MEDLLAEGFAFQEAGNLELAKRRYEAVLALQPENVEALNLLGVLHAVTRNFAHAIELFSQALDVEPDHVAVRLNRANACFEHGLLTKALVDLEAALKVEPRNAQGLLTQGNARQALGQLEEALASFDKAIEVQPDFAKAFNNRGLVLKNLGRGSEALRSYAEAIAIDPQYSEAFNNLGILFMSLGYPEQAVASIETAIAWRPTFAEAFNNLGNALNQLKRFDLALQSFDQALALRPNYVEVYSNRGNALKGLMRFDEAMASYEQAIKLDDQFAQGYNSRAVLLRDRGHLMEAFENITHALALNPADVDANSNYGSILSEIGHRDEAIKCFDQVLQDSPDNALAKWNKSILSLLLGDYQTGWRLYESGWQGGMRGVQRKMNRPLWLGDFSIEGKTILLHTEQGLGDTIQFCRYAKLVKHLGARVLLEAPKPLMSLLRSLEGVDELIEMGSPLPDFDCHCPLLSLPLAFRTDLDTVPSPTPYLYANTSLREAWAKKLAVRKKLKVGVVWNGGFRLHMPEHWGVNERRNIALSVFAESLNNLDVDFYSLQKGDPAESEIRGQELRYWPQGNFFNYADELNDFADTAALIANLDLVISVDTSTAHLAAALGKPTWILTRYDTCWRWLLERDDSPWYASVKLYRQGEDRDWATTLARVAADVRLI